MLTALMMLAFLVPLSAHTNCNPKKDTTCCKDLQPSACEKWTTVSPEQCASNKFVKKCRASCHKQYPLMDYCESQNNVDWGLDVTHKLPPSSFVRFKDVICTKDPLLLVSPNKKKPEFTYHKSPANIGSSATPRGESVQFNDHVGAAHAFCFGMEVQGLPYYNFRVGTAAEMLALSAVIKLPEQAMVLTYASSDGDDHDMGQIRTNLLWKGWRDSSYYNQADHHQSYYYDRDYQDPDNKEPSPPPPPPSPQPPPSPPAVEMQTVMGADSETSNDELRVHPYHNLAYCCSNHLYTKQDSEGSS